MRLLTRIITVSGLLIPGYFMFGQSITQNLTYENQKQVQVNMEYRLRSDSEEKIITSGNKLTFVFRDKKGAFIDLGVKNDYNFLIIADGVPTADKVINDKDYRLAVDPSLIQTGTTLKCVDPTEVTPTRKIGRWDITFEVLGEGKGEIKVPFRLGPKDEYTYKSGAFSIPYEVKIAEESYEKITALEQSHQSSPRPYQLYLAYHYHILDFQYFSGNAKARVDTFLSKKNKLVLTEWEKSKRGSIFDLCDFKQKYGIPSASRSDEVDLAIKAKERELWNSASDCERLKSYINIFSQPCLEPFGIHKDEATTKIREEESLVINEWKRILDEVNRIDACQIDRRRKILRDFKKRIEGSCAPQSIINDIVSKEKSLEGEYRRADCGVRPKTECEKEYEVAIAAKTIDAYAAFISKFENDEECYFLDEIKALYEEMLPIDSTINRISELVFSASLTHAKWPLFITQLQGPDGNILVWESGSEKSVFIDDTTLTVDTTYQWGGGSLRVTQDSLVFTLTEPSDYRVHIKDQRGFVAILSLSGSIAPIKIFGVNQTPEIIDFTVSGGEMPYMLKVKKDGITIRNFPLPAPSDSTEQGYVYSIPLSDYAGQLNEAGTYEFHITDSRNNEVVKLADDVRIKGKFPIGTTVYFSLFLLISIFLFIRNWKYQGKK